ncbi:hypothetical protein EMCRGX_G000090 [Ephydatia muelleri]
MRDYDYALAFNLFTEIGAPGKDAKSLRDIDPTVYEEKINLVCEWHLYASGPNKEGGQKNWVGNGSPSDRANIDEVMEDAHLYSRRQHYFLPGLGRPGLDAIRQHRWIALPSRSGSIGMLFCFSSLEARNPMGSQQTGKLLRLRNVSVDSDCRNWTQY